MRKKISGLLILMLVTSLFLATAVMADTFGEEEEEEPDLKLYSSVEIMEEFEDDMGWEEVQDTILDMGHKDAVDRDMVINYFTGWEEEVLDLEENDKTDVVTDLAANVGDIKELEDADYEKIEAFMDDLVELDEVEDITDDIIQEIEK